MTAPNSSDTTTTDPTARSLATSVLIFADLAGMPDTFWATDSRVSAACSTLGWSVAQGREWAAEIATTRPTWNELVELNSR